MGRDALTTRLENLGMHSNLRPAWTRIATGEDYDEHTAAVGQAQAAARLTVELLPGADLRRGSRIVIAGSGTGQMFDHLICTDLNPTFSRA
jgi:hypothetical protein